MIMGAGACFDPDDNYYVCDRWNNRFRKVDFKTGTVTTFAGSGRRRHHEDGSFKDCAVEPGGISWDPKRKSFYVSMVDSPDLGRLENGWLKTVIPNCHVSGRDPKGNIYSGGGRRAPYRFYRYVLQAGPKKKEGKK